MTVWQYAVAREANRLIQEAAQRPLTDKEERALDLLLPDLQRYEREDRIENARRNLGTSQSL